MRQEQSLVHKDCTISSDLVKILMCTVGEKCTVGAKSKLNNCVIMDNVVIGERYINARQFFLFIFICIPHLCLPRPRLLLLPPPPFNSLLTLCEFLTKPFIVKHNPLSVVLQNCVICSGAVIEAKVSLNECYVGEGYVVATGLRLKSEVLSV